MSFRRTRTLHPIRPARRAGTRGAGLLLCIAVAGAAWLVPGVAHAEFRLCNRTQSRIGVALAYKDEGNWTTEGWWNVTANSCETLLRGTLSSRFYYLYAVDYDQGGEWAGRVYMCTLEKEFTIRGIENCLARGYERTGFFEVDTQQQTNWTVQLTEGNQSRAPQVAVPLPPPMPNGARAQ